MAKAKGKFKKQNTFWYHEATTDGQWLGSWVVVDNYVTIPHDYQLWLSAMHAWWYTTHKFMSQKFHLWKFLRGKNCGREYIRWSNINLTLPIATKKVSRPAKKATKAARPAKKAAKPAKKAAKPAKKAAKPARKTAKKGGRKWEPKGLNIIIAVPLVFHKPKF